MGALAIATLAGSELLLGARTLHSLHQARNWLPDLDLATWALGSALIIPLVAAELRTRSRWRYDASRWSFVFPLGMYAVASRTLAQADKLALLRDVGHVFFVIALAAWSLVALGLARRTLVSDH
jgi:tellurite resistance protein TehA-like permease